MDNDISSFDLMQVLEKESKNAIVVKKMYVLMCERDYASAILLSQIMYWFGENKDGIKRAKMTHNGRACVIKQAYEWMEECELSFKQYNRALAYLGKRLYCLKESSHSSIHSYACLITQARPLCVIFARLIPSLFSPNQYII